MQNSPVLRAGARTVKRTDSFPSHGSISLLWNPVAVTRGTISLSTHVILKSRALKASNLGLLLNIFFISHIRQELKEAELFGILQAVPFRGKGWLVGVFMVTDRKQAFEQQGTKGMTGLPLLSRQDKPALRKTGHCCSQSTNPDLGRQFLCSPHWLLCTHPWWDAVHGNLLPLPNDNFPH